MDSLTNDNIFEGSPSTDVSKGHFNNLLTKLPGKAGLEGWMLQVIYVLEDDGEPTEVQWVPDDYFEDFSIMEEIHSDIINIYNLFGNYPVVGDLIGGDGTDLISERQWDTYRKRLIFTVEV